ncbi:MAG: phosphatidylserine decarboxylase [Gammaproteobacteria bacterium]|nr:phosphatidylserine decarboxylase [Gammaproteobacteria bacterium]
MQTPSWKDRLAVATQYLLPQHGLTRLMHGFARVRARPVKDLQIHWFLRRYGIDLSEALETDPRAYPDLNAFFTRALRPGARPASGDETDILAPADGLVSAAGMVLDGTLVQAKGHRFTAGELLGDLGLGPRYRDGSYLTVYLSPRDYHRVHMPVTGQLVEMRHVPGSLFSVNERTSRVVPGLFTRNERVVARFDTSVGEMALVLVGALIVGGIETVWSGPVSSGPGRAPVRTYPSAGPGAVRLERAQEMGRFNLGSTVIVLFPRGRVQWDPGIGPGSAVRVGARVGRPLQAPTAAAQSDISAPG